MDILSQCEEIPCNYCGAVDFKVLSRRDRYGLKTRTVICKKCGLIFINPRMTRDCYRKFYEGDYREVTRKYKNKKRKSMEEGFVSGKKFGALLAGQLKPYIKAGFTIDVGSGNGGILKGFQEVMPALKVLGIEPSSVAADFARQKGIETHTGLLEDFNIQLPFADNIIIVRSLNHLLDPKKFFTWAWHQLNPGGRLVIMVVNFIKACQRRGRFITQIDHPFMFSQDTLKNLLESGGFDIIFQDIDGSPDYIKLVGVKFDRKPFEKIKIDSGIYCKTLKSLNPLYLLFAKMFKKLWH